MEPQRFIFFRGKSVFCMPRLHASCRLSLWFFALKLQQSLQNVLIICQSKQSASKAVFEPDLLTTRTVFYHWNFGIGSMLYRK